MNKYCVLSVKIDLAHYKYLLLLFPLNNTKFHCSVLFFSAITNSWPSVCPLNPFKGCFSFQCMGNHLGLFWENPLLIFIMQKRAYIDSLITTCHSRKHHWSEAYPLSRAQMFHQLLYQFRQFIFYHTYVSDITFYSHYIWYFFTK